MPTFRVIAFVCALVTPVAVVSHDLVAFALSRSAEACCAATRGECAGLSTPDSCCRTQQMAASPDFTSTAPGLAHLGLAPISTPIVDLLGAPWSWSDVAVPDAFKRPHDPPHLHGFPLLI